MPTADTEVLFALNPKDRKHHDAIRMLRDLDDVSVPDTSILEFQIVLRGRGRDPAQVRNALLAINEVLRDMRVGESKTISTGLLALQCELEERHGLTYFDSLIAASSLTLDAQVISDDTAFDRIHNLTRIPLTRAADPVSSTRNP